MRKIKLLIAYLFILLNCPLSGQNFWEQSKFPDKIFSVSSILCNGKIIFVGTKSLRLYKSTDFGQTFNKINSGNGSDGSIAQLCYSKNYLLGLFGINIKRSSDNGKTWISYNLNQNEPLYNLNISCISTNDSIILAGGHMISGGYDSELWRSSNCGNNWQRVLTLEGNSYDKDAYIITLSARNDTLMLGSIVILTSNHADFPTYIPTYGIIRSTDSGRTWNTLNFGTQSIPEVIDFIWNSKNQIIALTTQGLIQSDDDGKTWFYPSGSIPTLKINCMIATPNDNLVIGTADKGIFISKDNGFSWEAMNNGVNDTLINILKSNKRGDIFAGTENKGFFRNSSFIDSTYIDSSEIDSTNIDTVNVKPHKFLLSQNYPNPFNPTTKIKYSIPSSSLVILKVYDLLGREITTLVNDEKPAGNYEINFSAKGGSSSGGDVSRFTSGIYFYSIRAGDYSEVKKMILLK